MHATTPGQPEDWNIPQTTCKIQSTFILCQQNTGYTDCMVSTRAEKKDELTLETVCPYLYPPHAERHSFALNFWLVWCWYDHVGYGTSYESIFLVSAKSWWKLLTQIDHKLSFLIKIKIWLKPHETTAVKNLIDRVGVYHRLHNNK